MRRLRALAVLTLASCAPRDPGLSRPREASSTRFEQRDLRVLDARLRYLDEGSGPPLLLLPGHTSRVEELEGLVGRLRGRFRVLVFDFPGSGYSEKPVRRYDLRYYEDAALAFLDELKLPRVHLAGGSQGGHLALRLAARAPERFDRLVVWAPGGAWKARPLLARVIRLGGYALFPTVVRIQSGFWYRPGWEGRVEALSDTFAYYSDVLGPGFVRMYFGLAADQVGVSLFDLAAEVRRPVLLLWGDRDHGAGMGAGVRRLHSLLPRSEFAVLADSGHSLAAERPDELSAKAAEFLLRPEGRLPAERAGEP